MKRLLTIMKCVNIDTHLWCVSVLGGAVLLCLSFFVEPTQLHYELPNEENAVSFAKQIVVEYSSVLGSLSNIETLGEEEVDRIVEAIPDYIEDMTKETAEDTALPQEKDDTQEIMETFDPSLYASSTGIVASSNSGDVDILHVYTPEAIDALERLVQCEAESEDADGRMLVADVVLNRVDTGIWGNDILSVIESPGQFKPVDSGAVKTVTVDRITKEAVISALVSEDISKGAIYFQKSPQKVWGNKQYLFRHGSHSFYR